MQMRFSHAFALCCIVFLPCLVSAQQPLPYGYEWMNREPDAAVTKRVAESTGHSLADWSTLPWRFSAGYSARQLDASFRVGAPNPAALKPYFRGTAGRGDVGVFGGGDTVYYDNGWVGLDSRSQPGVATNFGSYTPDPDVLNGRYGDELRWDLSGLLSNQIAVIGSQGDRHLFYSSAFGPPAGSGAFAEGAASDWGAGPSVRWSLVLEEDRSGSLGLSLGWTGLSAQMRRTDLSMGPPTLVTYFYEYQATFIPSTIVFPGVWDYGLVYDRGPASVSSVSSFLGPEAFDNPRAYPPRVIPLKAWKGVADVTLNADLQEVFLSADLNWKPWPGWELGLSVGPTLNVLRTDLRTSKRWVRRDGVQTTAEHDRSQETKATVGAAGEAIARYSLSKDGSSYLEARAGYHWLESLSVGAPGATAEIDASNWELALGVGFRLDQVSRGSPWTVKAGASARTLAFNAQPVFDRTSLAAVGGRGGRGDVGLYRGGSQGVYYDDGLIDASGGFTPGTISGVTTTPSQINRNTGRQVTYQAAVLVPISEVTFHSSDFTQRLKTWQGEDVTARDWGVGPYFELSRRITSDRNWSAGFTLGWEAVASDMTSGWQPSGMATLERNGRVFSYSYDLIDTIFIEQDPSRIYGILYDPEAARQAGAYSSGEFLLPRKTVETYRGTVVLNAFSQAYVDVSLQSLAFTGDFNWQPFPRCEVGLSAGPTLNLVTTDLLMQTFWIESSGRFAGQDLRHERHTQVKAGLKALLSARYDLSSSGRWFVEARGGIDWMPDVDIGGAGVSSSLENAAWTVSAGLGCRLGAGGPRVPEIQNAGRRPRS